MIIVQQVQHLVHHEALQVESQISSLRTHYNHVQIMAKVKHNKSPNRTLQSQFHLVASQFMSTITKYVRLSISRDVGWCGGFDLKILILFVYDSPFLTSVFKQEIMKQEWPNCDISHYTDK